MLFSFRPYGTGTCPEPPSWGLPDTTRFAKDNISFHYRCFDRMLFNATTQPFQQPEQVVGFFSTYRKTYPVTRNVLRDANLPDNRISTLDKLYLEVSAALDNLLEAVGLDAA